MPYEFYKILHLSSILALFMSLGIFWYIYSFHGNNAIIRKKLLTLHGIVHFFILLSGFGLLVKLNIHSPWSVWIYLKLGIWLLLGASPVLIRKLNREKKWQIYFNFLMILLTGIFATFVAQQI